LKLAIAFSLFRTHRSLPRIPRDDAMHGRSQSLMPNRIARVVASTSAVRATASFFLHERAC
ncbi:MAG: hypothetical protein ACJ8HC_02295, partial [Paraburkholderia graminis]|uniref:hypothetical protein n=1 Tax=Paraburkholderia graminis TaxID=60548 RepID=UPI00389AAB45